ncbi:hypothetical protein OH720_14015 [Pseudomonas sp. WJP1]|uniref:hypothetical protein n=1 Tax=Pseudomonas sp. WJP1 TaxID=2986947 RepID=UPI00234A11EA|nr:hypothetical protein [Pseudomonas sp. WJP1]WCM54068.1 hypothetical protein OH720_14015 [Pseudomonas sp. WJP1]
MKLRNLSCSGALFPLGLTLGLAATAHADQFIGFAQPGVPGSWAVESFPVINRTAEDDVRAGSNTVLAYFTETGFTGTHRDQFEFWVGAVPGYSSTDGGGSDNGWGIASPNIGIEYYYNVIEPTKPYASSDYVTFWTSPTLMVEFPNGNHDVDGFGAGFNRYAYSLSLANYLQIGKFAVTFTPAGIYYAEKDRNTTDFGEGDPKHLRGGVSLWLGDIAAGYLVTDTLWLGVHHVYNINNRTASDFEESREGKVGPSMTYTGWAKEGIYVSANLNFDYYHTDNLPYSNSLTMALVKSF